MAGLSTCITDMVFETITLLLIWQYINNKVDDTMKLKLGERLKELRLEKRLTQAEIAKALGLNSVTYLRYEKSQREPPLELLITIADYYDVTLDYLFGRTNF